MFVLVRLAVASLSGLVALAGSRFFWGVIDSASNPTNAYIAESQHVVEVASTVIFVVAAFAAGLAWRN